MVTLYELEGRQGEIGLELDHTDDPELINALLDELEALNGAIDDKLVCYSCLIKNLDSDIEAIDIEVERLKAKSGALGRKVESVKKRLMESFKPGDKWQVGPHSLSYRKSEAVEVVDDKLIPAIYMREILKYEPDKKQIKEDLKCGSEIPGARLETRQNLVIK